MAEAQKTILILSEERNRRACRSMLGKVVSARIELELLSFQGSLSAEAIEEISQADPQILFIDLPKDRENGLSLLCQLHQEFPELPMLATGDTCDPVLLQQAMRFGVKELLPRGWHPEQLKQAFQRTSRPWFHPKRRSASIFSFLGSKGGSGTTSIATNLAGGLAILSKKKLLVIDLNLPLGNVADCFGIKNNKYLLDGKPGTSISDPEVISHAIISHQETGVDLLSLAQSYRRERSIANEIVYLLNFLQREYDYIVVDASSSIEENTIAALDASHLVFLISKCDLPSLRNTQRVLEAFHRWGLTDSSRVRLIVNRYSKEQNISLKRIEKVLDFKVFWSIANAFNSLNQSIQLGKLLTEKREPLPIVESFFKLSAQILGIQSDVSYQRHTDEFLVRTRGSATASEALRLIPSDPSRS